MTEFITSKVPEPHLGRHREMMKTHGPLIADLTGRNPWSFAIVLGLVAAQLSVSKFLTESHWGVILLAAYLFGAFLNHALYVFIHEATHNLIFKAAWANRLTGILCDWALVFPGAMGFRKFHMAHHSKMGDYSVDADIPSLTELQWVRNHPLSKAIWVLFLGVFQSLRPLRFKHAAMIDGWVMLNIFCQAVALYFIFQLSGLAGLFYLFFSTFFCLGLHPLGGRWIAEHYVQDAEQETYSYYGPVNQIMFNIGFHHEHHDFMSIPWNKLPRLREIAPEYYQGLHFHKSYTGLLWDFLINPRQGLSQRVLREASSEKIQAGT